MESVNRVSWRAIGENFFHHITLFSVYQVMKNNLFFILFWNNFAFPERVICFLSFVSKQYGCNQKHDLQDWSPHNKSPGRIDSWWLAAKALPIYPHCTLLKQATWPNFTALPRNSLHQWQPNLRGWSERYKACVIQLEQLWRASFSAPHRRVCLLASQSNFSLCPLDFPHSLIGVNPKSTHPRHQTS